MFIVLLAYLLNLTQQKHIITEYNSFISTNIDILKFLTLVSNCEVFTSTSGKSSNVNFTKIVLFPENTILIGKRYIRFHETLICIAKELPKNQEAGSFYSCLTESCNETKYLIQEYGPISGKYKTYKIVEYSKILSCENIWGKTWPPKRTSVHE